MTNRPEEVDRFLDALAREVAELRRVAPHSPWRSHERPHRNLTAVAMSGGLDSSVTAWLLARRGPSPVIGLSMLLWDHSGVEAHGRCCGALDLGDARRVAQQAGIPHYTLRMDEEFRAEGGRSLRRRTTWPAARRARACAATPGSSSTSCSSGRGAWAPSGWRPATTPASWTAPTVRSCTPRPIRRRTRATTSSS